MEQCRFCKKKYARQSKLIDHIEKTHPFASYASNNKQLSPTQLSYLLQQLQAYIPLIQLTNNIAQDTIENAIQQYINWDGTSDTNEAVSFVWASHLLLPQLYSAYLATGAVRPADFKIGTIITTIPIKITNQSLTKDLTRITLAHLEFCKRAQESGLLEKAVSSSNQLDNIFNEFNRFLNLGYQCTGDNFCPSLIIDLVWHASMLNHQMYNELMFYFVRKQLPHCLEENEDKTKQKARYEKFLQQYNYFHRKPALQISNLIMGEEQEVFSNLKQKYAKLELERLEQIRLQKIADQEEKKRLEKEEQEQLERRRLEAIESEQRKQEYIKKYGYDAYEKSITPPGWRSPTDDGKC